MQHNKLLRKSGALLLAASLSLPALIPASTLLPDPLAVQAAESLAQGTLQRAPQSADLEEAGNLDWIHFCSKEQSGWAGRKAGLISDITMTGTMAQIMSDTDTNFVYTGAPAANRKGQVINKIGGKTTFTLPASLQERYVSIFTGSWASQISLKLFINDEEVYSNVHGKKGTINGAESFLTQIHYHTQSEEDIVRVEIETIEVFDSVYGNHSIQAITLSDKFSDFSGVTSTDTVDALLEAAPAKVNLSKHGTLDWIALNSKDSGSFDRKDVPEGPLGELSVIGRSDYVTSNSKTDFIYSDGMISRDSESPNHKALVFTGAGNGLSFEIAGSDQERTLDIYTGAWAADITATVECNGTKVLEKTFGATDTTPGSAATYQVLRLNLHPGSESDKLKVSVVVSKAHDASWGNMNIGAITLGNGRIEDDGSIISGSVKDQPAYCDLDAEDLQDWLFFNNAELTNAARKNIETPLLDEITLIGKAQNPAISKKAKTSFNFTNAKDGSSADDSHDSFVFLGKGSGISVKLPASTTKRYVNVYAGAWASDVTMEILVNGKVQYTTGFSSSSTVPDTTQYEMASLRYQCAKADDEVVLRVTASHIYDAQWGNFNLSAITLSDHEPEAPVESLENENWVVDHTGGRIHSLQARIGEEMVNIPVRNDSYSGFSWKINGQNVALAAAQEQEDGSLLYSGRYRRNNADLGVSLSYELGEKGELLVHASLTNNKDEAVSLDKASLQMGLDTYLERFPTYNDQLFPTMMRCEKTHAWGYFSSPSGMLMTFATDAPVASYTLDYESGAHRIYSGMLDLLCAGKLPDRHPQGLDHLDANETKEWTITLKMVDARDDVDAVKPTLHQVSAIPVFDADRYTLSSEEESDITLYSASLKI